MDHSDGEDSKDDVLARALSQASDLFDAEIESDEESSRRPPPPIDSEPDEETIEALIRRKSKQRARKPKQPKRPTKREIQINFSESQRILRERPLNLPDYKPKEKTMEQVLAAVRQRQKSVGLKPGISLTKNNLGDINKEDEHLSCPRLSSKNDEFFIEITEESRSTGVGELIGRFQRHCQKQKSAGKTQESPDEMENGEQVFTKPGASKMAWKEKLQKEMQAKRASLREQMAAVKKIDEEDIDVEEEEEMTDTDISSEEEETENVTKMPKEREGTMLQLTLSESESEDEDDISMLAVKPAAPRVNLSQMSDLFDEVEDDDFDPVDLRPFAMFSQQAKDSGFGPSSTQLEPTDEATGKAVEPALDLDVSAIGDAARASPFTVPSLPVTVNNKQGIDKITPEDSLDLYGESQSSFLPLGQRHLGYRGDETNISAFDDESRLFDSQGFFNIKKDSHMVRSKLRHHQWKLPLPPSLPPPPPLPAKDQENSQDDSTMDEFLGLCSGQFASTRENSVPSNGESDVVKQTDQDTTSSQSSKQNTRRNLFKHIERPTDDNDNAMDEMLGLCSGQFAGVTEFQKEEKEETRTDSLSESFSSQVNEEEETSKAAEEDEDEDEEKPLLKQRKQKKQRLSEMPALGKSIYQRSLAKFFEEEAELSGEDVGSDEDEDDNPEMDEYEQDEQEDEELALVSQLALQQQVEKIHNKQVMMEDQEDVEAFKDRYLGEDYEEGLNLVTGLFRTKRYIRQMDEDSQADMFAGDQDSIFDEKEDPDASLSQMETVRRKHRFERDNFLREERMKHGSSDLIEPDEDSQTILNLIKEDSHSQPNSVIAVPPQLLLPATPKAYSKQMSKAGSFLNRSKISLSVLQAVTANAPSLKVASRGCGFQSTKRDSNNGQKRGASVKRSESAKSAVPSKKPKFLRSNSVFATMT